MTSVKEYKPTLEEILVVETKVQGLLYLTSYSAPVPRYRRGDQTGARSKV